MRICILVVGLYIQVGILNILRLFLQDTIHNSFVKKLFFHRGNFTSPREENFIFKRENRNFNVDNRDDEIIG